MNYDFNQRIDRLDNFSVKWTEMEDRFGSNDLLPMWIADMDFNCPSFIMNALRDRLEQGIFGYVSEPDSYNQSIVDWLDNRYGWKIKSNQLLYSPKVITSLSVIINTLTSEHDKIMILQPVYSPFSSLVIDNNRELVITQLIKNDDNSYMMDYEDIENKITDVKMLILCNPHNPVGRVWSKDELTKLGNICLKHNVKIISDEIHSDIILKGHKHTPMASISQDIANNTITCMAPTKTFNLAGLHTSFIVIYNEDDYHKLSFTLSKLDLSSNNAFSLVATQAAYTYGEDWLTSLIEYIEGNIDFSINYIRTNIPSIKVAKPQGTYLLWLDCTSLNIDDDTLQKAFIEVGKIALNEGYTFGKGGSGFFRMNLACPRYMVEDALHRINLAINSLK